MNKRIEEIFQKFEDAMDLGEGVSMDYYLKEVGYSVKQAEAELTAFFLELVGEDEPTDSTQGDYWEVSAQNSLRAELRAKIQEREQA